MVCALVGIPLPNAHGAYEYGATLAALGFSARSVGIEDVTRDVTDAFSRGAWSPLWTVKAVAWLLGVLMRQAGLRFVLVAATKKRCKLLPRTARGSPVRFTPGPSTGPGSPARQSAAATTPALP
jgi:hypothetical protein